MDSFRKLQNCMYSQQLKIHFRSKQLLQSPQKMLHYPHVLLKYTTEMSSHVKATISKKRMSKHDCFWHPNYIFIFTRYTFFTLFNNETSTKHNTFQQTRNNGINCVSILFLIIKKLFYFEHYIIQTFKFKTYICIVRIETLIEIFYKNK